MRSSHSARTWCSPSLSIVRPGISARRAFATGTGELTGRRIIRVTVSDDAWKDRLIAQGTPEQFASFALEIFTASRRGEFAAVDPALKQLLGREPTSFREVLAATLPH
jgi:NAD(P)H dehydrogenase (quinone)